jgi:hypothetical protein
MPLASTNNYCRLYPFICVHSPLKEQRENESEGKDNQYVIIRGAVRPESLNNRVSNKTLLALSHTLSEEL